MGIGKPILPFTIISLCIVCEKHLVRNKFDRMMFSGVPLCACACATSQMLAILRVVLVDEPVCKICLKSAGVVSGRDRHDMAWSICPMLPGVSNAWTVMLYSGHRIWIWIWNKIKLPGPSILGYPLVRILWMRLAEAVATPFRNVYPT